MSPIFRLCYVDKPWAYFTTQKLSDQWGDDWEDAPYEHNAGAPYSFTKGLRSAESPWEILKVAFDGGFDGDLETPCDIGNPINSSWCVKDINAGAIAWLQTPLYCTTKIIIPAGTTYHDFRTLMKQAGSTVYKEETNYE